MFTDSGNTELFPQAKRAKVVSVEKMMLATVQLIAFHRVFPPTVSRQFAQHGGALPLDDIVSNTSGTFSVHAQTERTSQRKALYHVVWAGVCPGYCTGHCLRKSIHVLAMKLLSPL
jgi:hypothetical protein